jgi:citrate lyase synthetase
MISCFKNCTSQEVLNEIDIYSALDIIKIPHPAILDCIIEARSCKEIGKNKEYSQIKRSLPAVTFNFSFDD